MHQPTTYGGDSYCFDCGAFCGGLAPDCSCCTAAAFPKTGETPGNRVEDYPAEAPGTVDVSQYPVSESVGSQAEVTYDAGVADWEADGGAPRAF